jgi:hypothetical protein
MLIWIALIREPNNTSQRARVSGRANSNIWWYSSLLCALCTVCHPSASEMAPHDINAVAAIFLRPGNQVSACGPHPHILSIAVLTQLLPDALVRDVLDGLQDALTVLGLAKLWS